MTTANCSLDSSLSRDDFANLLIKHLRASGETGPIEYDAVKYVLVKPQVGHCQLQEFYERYANGAEPERENVIRKFSKLWHMISVDFLQDPAKLKASLFPAVRSRAEFEFDFERVLGTDSSDVDIPREVLGDHLAVALVSNLTQPGTFLNTDVLDFLGLSFAEAMQIATDNLREDINPFVKKGELYAFVSREVDMANQLLLTDYVRSLEVVGDTIATIPNRNALFVCGSEDAIGLEHMANLTQANLNVQQSISGMAFRLVGDEWEVWLPPEDHPTRGAFHELYLHSLGQAYAKQREFLHRQYEKGNVGPFVASFTVSPIIHAGPQTSICTWSEGVPALLPEADHVFFCRPHAATNQQVVGHADWNAVRNLVGELMEPLGMYPERWRVREFPTESVLQQLPRMTE